MRVGAPVRALQTALLPSGSRRSQTSHASCKGVVLDEVLRVQDPSQSTMHARLRAETASDHEMAESAVDLLGATLSRESYRATVALLYGFQAPIEAALAETAAEVGCGLALRPRAHELARDLSALGLSAADVDALPRCAVLPVFERREHVVGSLYVIEGSRLGGRIVARALIDRLGIDAATGGAYFHGDGDVGARWREVLAWLEREAEVCLADQVIAAARDTFATLNRWARQRRVAS